MMMMMMMMTMMMICNVFKMANNNNLQCVLRSATVSYSRCYFLQILGSWMTPLLVYRKVDITDGRRDGQWHMSPTVLHDTAQKYASFTFNYDRFCEYEIVTCQQTEWRGEGVDQIVCRHTLLRTVRRFDFSIAHFRFCDLFSYESSTLAHEMNLFYFILSFFCYILNIGTHCACGLA
jgi:hypothetical protein